MKQPRWPATSPMTAVQIPIAPMAITNVGYPWPMATIDGHCTSNMTYKAGENDDAEREDIYYLSFDIEKIAQSF